MNGMGDNNNAQQAAQQGAQVTAQMRQQVLAAPDATCAKCGGAYFENIYKVKRVSALMSPNGQETIVPVQTLRCLGCGNTLDDISDFTPPPTPEAAVPPMPPMPQMPQMPPAPPMPPVPTAEPIVKTDNT